MDEKLKEKWCVKLESGEFPQQRNGHLKDKDGYCCLGVLREVDGDGEWLPATSPSFGMIWKSDSADERESYAMLDVNYLDLIGLSLSMTQPNWPR